MPNIDRAYARDIHRNLNAYAAWEPSTDFEIGDYGLVRGKIFQRMGNIYDDFDIKLTTKTTKDASIRKWESSRGISYNHKGKIKIKGVANAENDITFTRKNSIIFRSEGLKTVRLRNYKKVGDELLKVYKKRGNEWKLRYHVITELTIAEALLVIISQSKNAKATLLGGVKKIKSVADIRLDESLEVSGSGIFMEHNEVDDGDFATPLFELSKIFDPITGKPSFRIKR